MTMRQMPAVQVIPETVTLRGGLDVTAPPLAARPGTKRLAFNYEPATGGGDERIGGIESFDGQTAPNEAEYAYLMCDDVHTAVVGDTVTGGTSAATGKVIYVNGVYLAVTRVTGTFEADEDIEVASVAVGTLASVTETVDGFLDNELYALAAIDYRLDVLAVPGSGPIRGLEILNSEVFAWRNDTAPATELTCYKATSSGWTEVPLFYELSFTLGSGTQPAEGATLTQGGVTAVIKRVVLESGTWGAGTAAGRYIIDEPAGGNFAAGAFATAANGTIPAAGAGVYHGTQIPMLPNGRVRADVSSFVGTASSQRLYACDGVNREFEFDGTVLVPIVTGMGSVRAQAVRVHRNQLCYAFVGSLQRSGVGEPYQWTPLTGADELGAGDTITDLVSVGGSETAAALMVLCTNSILVLYGDDPDTVVLKVLSRVSGGSAKSAHDIGGVVALDAPGFSSYPATQAFGNFRWDTISEQIEPLVKGQSCECSVWIANASKYRCFFTDGSAVTGVPVAKRKFEWSTIDYDRTIVCAVHAEINGTGRTFYGDDAGFVYEADVGRSFAGDPIQAALRTNQLTGGSPDVIKQYRRLAIEVKPQSAMTLSVQADFYGDDDEGGTTAQTVTQAMPTYGAGLLWDLSNFDQAYWDVNETSRKRYPLEGQGTSVALTLASESDNELPHTIPSLTISYTPRRQAR